ncbi:hypothetical protein DM01DRAFT_1406453 [Hesseltinella vesiculosa]|uniref:GOST seven transmembrane domain-containing protein n=1 Tax=Hesseltinella vesiculosa TaxID=101127 RepID=A0A1X2GM98_9FUNG|nr:hypothetical protein DM01DRAFT_1406453 [Hesseltinella vesiculosa]
MTRVLSILCLLLLATIIHARPPLTLTQDDRKLVEVAKFGFLPGGQLSLQLEHLEFSNETSPGDVAFYIRRAQAFTDDLEPSRMRSPTVIKDCFLDNSFVKDEVEDQVAQIYRLIDNDNLIKTWNTSITVQQEQKGVWQVLFVNCKQSLVSFKLTVNEVNPGNNYLSAGDSPLPTVYGFASFTYVLMAAYWSWLLVYRKDTTVFRAHWLMLLLLVVIVVNKALQAAKYHYMKVGILSEGWSIGFYVFTSIRGLLSILIIVLLASGWMFIKPFLSSKDKTVISIVVPLQILANVAAAIRNEAAIGSSDWSFWTMLFPFIDLMACAVILWTILQTRKNLSNGASADGKETDVLNKYKLWSSFYVVTLVYMYVTRIIVQLLQAILPFQYVTWFGEAISEGATVLFYSLIGWKFRPYANNPYMQVATNDEEDTMEDYSPTYSDTVRLHNVASRHE